MGNELKFNHIEQELHLLDLEQVRDQLQLVASALTVDLFDDELRVTHPPEFSNAKAEHQGKPRHQAFILRNIIGGLEEEVDNVPELLSDGGVEYHACTGNVVLAGAVKV